jgi:uncharacterized BrkB/YihY/UPF0761 family membrane protein|nr:hypothetical protein [uncultured Methanoregula sp.]
MPAHEPQTWYIYAYSFVLLISLFMLAATIIFVFLHCQRVLALDSSPGTCGVGIGWVLIGMAFAAIAGYSGWQVYRIMQQGE